VGNIELGRLSSNVLTEVRTVLSRTETAIGYIERNPNLWVRYPKNLYSRETREYIAEVPGEKILHPDVEEMLAVLMFTRDKLKKWEKTGKAKHREGQLDVSP